MPTLNLGRVRFNWKGAYDPDASYLKYDCIEDDGQSYVCIAPVTGTRPNEAGGDAYWGSMLVRSADYNQARDDAIQAASDAGDSKAAAASSAVAATTQAGKAEGEADRAEGYANGLSLPSATGNGGLFLRQNSDETGLEYVRFPPGHFCKEKGAKVAWSDDGSSVTTNQYISVEVVGGLRILPPGTVVSLPVLSGGTDYVIYALEDGTLQGRDTDATPLANGRIVGGFHVFLTGEIAEKSMWDLHWKPDCPNPRAMVLSPAGEWGDIYLMDVDYGLLGYSRPNVTIADDGNRPIIPAYYGGDGTARYGSMSWWVSVDLASAAGKRLFGYAGFTAAAYGVVENQSVGTDPVTTQHQAGHRSACGLEQATGVMHQWGADIVATAGSGWSSIAEGRGSVYASNLKAVLLSASWGNAGNSGSRASHWNNSPDASRDSTSSRAACGHLNLS